MPVPIDSLWVTPHPVLDLKLTRIIGSARVLQGYHIATLDDNPPRLENPFTVFMSYTWLRNVLTKPDHHRTQHDDLFHHLLQGFMESNPQTQPTLLELCKSLNPTNPTDQIGTLQVTKDQVKPPIFKRTGASTKPAGKIAAGH